ncbi:MAG: MFS transporter [Gammaproteobacteria bacterium]|uniref:MFS transporter n=1 Tax=Hydrogenophaga sp. TaxID=1904254 RepID=UPI0025C07929|nr:MFS transporter [Hydrogenophaga sp.]MBU4182467.1 MFS transporter [Gammaproteobacteria bacterium]MBU4282155.1 MFS transporter [Gammaproteobacteria bacterium]MBU4322281.1 MFS transporter [Gammaproteobacteria bacterium]MBU4504822.1 MFS transporter [Gammaproteobacteria bacterium]MCG2654036.1 MFS transporter [Hydrogenophaga sp.]
MTPQQARIPRHILPVLVTAQFAGTSLWFAVNAVMPDLQRELGWPASAVGPLTSALQFGFIMGTLVFALLAIADRFSARKVFLFCALAGAACTVGAWAMVTHYEALLVWRFFTGVFLAGIYPVGMKIAAQWYTKGLGAALGLLIGALVLGSASAHALRALSGSLPWPTLMLGVAALAAAGGLLLFFGTGDPPHAHARVTTLQWRALGTVWTDARVRASVLGYFGHMWELYTVWVMVPLVLATRLQGANLSWAAFWVLGAGVIGCAGGGWVAQRWGSARVASAQLATSGLCCLATPFVIDAPALLFYAWLVLWGITVSGDSPQFSTLTARNAPPQAVGSVLTLTNSIGFGISIVSILLFVSLSQTVELGTLLPWLAMGPALGLWAMARLVREEAQHS